MTEFEERIIDFFNNESKRMQQRHKDDGLPNSAKELVKIVTKSDVKTALDVGSGPGSVMIELLHEGVDEVTGVDLSSNMNEIANKRLKEEGLEERSKVILGSFMDIEIAPQDAIIMHRVLCCNPNKTEMIQRSVELKPTTIAITIMRDWKILRGLIGIIGFVLDKLGRFRPFVHSQKAIDNELRSHGYKVKERKKDLFWTTTIYILHNSTNTE